ncbi:unnamed protein product [Owenia fusiformis]|uniref:F-box domain-containing protein n=1 Tax=Owenia fusiformis TaxID=6347 RepID=A0A8J1XME1_OWEFU|nr:unnamed protein product [Owenia fusiformis]
MTTKNQRIDVNTATVEDLEGLIGIGHGKAEAIVEHRNKVGGFQTLCDLIKVPGIGPGVVDPNRSMLSCSMPANIKTPRSKCERETRSTVALYGASPECHWLPGTTRSRQPQTEQLKIKSEPGMRLRCHGNEPEAPESRDWIKLCSKIKTEPSASSSSCSSNNSLESTVCPLKKETMDSYVSPVVNPYKPPFDNFDASSESEDESDTEDEIEAGRKIVLNSSPSPFKLRSRIPVPVLSQAIGKHFMKRKSEQYPDVILKKKPCHLQQSDPTMRTFGTIKTSGASTSTPRRRIPSKQNPPPELAHWLKVFQGWSNAERLLALDELIEQCDPTQVRHMMAVIEPQFQRDFISLLPKELALYVLSFLDPKDLLQAAQTCRYWRILAEDNLLWREKCNQENIDEALVFGPRVRRKSLSPLVSSPKAPCPYKALYMRQHQIEQNWRTGSVKNPKVLKGHDDHVITCLEFCGNRIVSGSDDNTLKVWSALTGKCLRTLVGHTGGVWSSQMQGNVIISGSTDRTLKVWNADTGQCTHTLYGHTSTVRCMHLFENIVVSGSRDATLRMWNIDSGQCLHVLMGHVAAVRCVQYDGRRVVSGAYDYMVKIWDPDTETCLHTLQGHTNRVYSLQFDGAHIVSGSLDTSIRVWDVETGNCLHTLIGHQSLTSGMELKDNILVSGNADSTVKVWDILTGQCLQTLQGTNKHQSAVTCLQFNRKFVITSSDDGTVKIWDLKNGEFVRNLVSLDSGGSGGVVWRVRCSNTKLVCAVGSRNGTEETKLLVLDFDVEEHFGLNSALKKL